MAAPPAAGDGPAATFRACGRGAAWASAGVTQFWADLTLNEVSGAMGDLGVFLPLAVRRAAAGRRSQPDRRCCCASPL
jgi:hypothetical protein